jgi:hypothetical protein
MAILSISSSWPRSLGDELRNGMGVPRTPEPVKYFCGILASDSVVWTWVVSRLTERLGPIDAETEWMPFIYTTYYDAEMGRPIERKFVSFEPLQDPGELAAVKRWTNDLEAEVRRTHSSGRRVINLDPGWLNLHQVVLASTKPAGHRIYIGAGIYAELTLWFRDGRWTALPWTYPDYRESAAVAFFAELRDRYRRQRHRWLKSPSPVP